MTDVFISYSWKDSAFARLIWESLKQSEIEPWIDWEHVEIGQRWKDEVSEAIVHADAFLFITSKNSINSKYCKLEIECAEVNHKRIIPILVDDLTPDDVEKFSPDLPYINRIIFERDRIFRIEEASQVQSDKPEDRQVAVALQPQFDDALGKLAEAIHTDWTWVKTHTRLQVEALQWHSSGNNPVSLLRGAALEESEHQLLSAAGKDPQPTSLQVEYVTDSRKVQLLKQKARQRQRWMIMALGIGLVVAVVLGFVALLR